MNKTNLEIPLQDPRPLWQMKPEEFNRWRQKNDLPILFDYFRYILPGFEDWLKTFEPKPGCFLEIAPTGDLFKGEGDKWIVEYETEKKELVRQVVSSGNALLDVPKQFKHEITVKQRYAFVPYLKWGRAKFKREKFIICNCRNHDLYDSFVYNSWECSGPQRSRAQLFHEFKVLKLGGVDLGGIQMGDRNLDFTDLDHIAFKTDWYGSRYQRISYSSIENMRFYGGSLIFAFMEFEKCHIKDMRFDDCRIQDFHFKDVEGMNAAFRNVRMNKISFNNCDVRPDFDKCEILDIDFKPRKAQTYEGIFEFYRRLRVAFQNEGKRDQARRYYYLERHYQTKIQRKFILHNRKEFVLRRGYSGTLKNVFDQYRNRQFDFKTSLKHSSQVLWFYIRIFTIPKYLWLNIKSLFAYLISLFDELVWGYGERPGRIFLVAASALILFSGIFYFSSHDKLHYSMVNSLYFSMVTFTTLGYGDITPQTSQFLKIACGLEALIGASCMGLLVAGFSNRSRY